jgi:predicted CopG family antitoxin
MKKTTTKFSAQLVTFETSVPFSEFITRLDNALNKEGSSQIISQLKGANSREQIEKIVNGIRGQSDFL